MSLTSREIAQLKKIVGIAQGLLGKASAPARAKRPAKRNGAERSRVAGRGNGAARTRRSGKELLAFRKMLKAERKAGVPVAEIAKKHGVSASYIYQL